MNIMIKSKLNHRPTNVGGVAIHYENPLSYGLGMWLKLFGDKLHTCGRIHSAVELLALDTTRKLTCLIIHVTRVRYRESCVPFITLLVVSISIRFPAPYNEWWNDRSSSIDCLQYQTELTTSLCHHCLGLSISCFSDKCYGPDLITPHGNPLLIAVPQVFR